MNTPEQRFMQKMHQADENGGALDRRKHDRLLELVLANIEKLSESHEAFLSKFDAHLSDTHIHREAIASKITGNEHIVATILDGFPNKDPRGHCDYHEDQMAAIARRKEFWSKLLAELTKYGLIGFVGWLFTLAWAAAVKGPK